MVAYINCSSYAWQKESPFPLYSCSLKQPGVSRCPRHSLLCLAISLIKSLEVLKSLIRLPQKWLQSQYFIRSPWKSCSLEVLKSLSATKSLYSCIPLLFYHSPHCCFLSAATSTFFFDHQITQSSSVLVSRPYLGLSLNWLSREYLLIFYPLLSIFLCSFLIPQKISPNRPSDCWSCLFSTCPPSVECQRSWSWLLRPRRMSWAGSLNKGATNLLPRTEIPMSAVNRMTLLGEGKLCHSFAEASRVGGEWSWC